VWASRTLCGCGPRRQQQQRCRCGRLLLHHRPMHPQLPEQSVMARADLVGGAGAAFAPTCTAVVSDTRWWHLQQMTPPQLGGGGGGTVISGTSCACMFMCICKDTRAHGCMDIRTQMRLVCARILWHCAPVRNKKHPRTCTAPCNHSACMCEHWSCVGLFLKSKAAPQPRRGCMIHHRPGANTD
jgi:hypothetical protein